MIQLVEVGSLDRDRSRRATFCVPAFQRGGMQPCLTERLASPLESPFKQLPGFWAQLELNGWRVGSPWSINIAGDVKASFDWGHCIISSKSNCTVNAADTRHKIAFLDASCSATVPA